jgi:hypothetical protein
MSKKLGSDAPEIEESSEELEDEDQKKPHRFAFSCLTPDLIRVATSIHQSPYPDADPEDERKKADDLHYGLRSV